MIPSQPSTTPPTISFSLQCLICLNQYNSTDNYPTIICPQHHHICSTCVESLYKTRVTSTCPVCRKQVRKDQARRFRELEQIRESLKILTKEYTESTQAKHQQISKLKSEKQRLDAIVHLSNQHPYEIIAESYEQATKLLENTNKKFNKIAVDIGIRQYRLSNIKTNMKGNQKLTKKNAQNPNHNDRVLYQLTIVVILFSYTVQKIEQSKQPKVKIKDKVVRQFGDKMNMFPELEYFQFRFEYMLADMEIFQNLVSSLNSLSKLKTVVVIIKGGKPIMTNNWTKKLRSDIKVIVKKE